MDLDYDENVPEKILTTSKTKETLHIMSSGQAGFKERFTSIETKITSGIIQLNVVTNNHTKSSMPYTDVRRINVDLPYYNNASQKSLLTTRGNNEISDKVSKGQEHFTGSLIPIKTITCLKQLTKEELYQDLM